MNSTTLFVSRKSPFLWILWGALILLAFWFLLFAEGPRWALLPMIVPILLLTGTLFRTDYRIKGDKLFYRTGFFRGSVAILTIRKIERNQTLWAGYKAAAATRGLVIHYNQFDDLYVTPQREDDFLTSLKRINPAIEVRG